jgi:hypothetical protein
MQRERYGAVADCQCCAERLRTGDSLHGRLVIGTQRAECGHGRAACKTIDHAVMREHRLLEAQIIASDAREIVCRRHVGKQDRDTAPRRLQIVCAAGCDARGEHGRKETLQKRSVRFRAHAPDDESPPLLDRQHEKSGEGCQQQQLDHEKIDRQRFGIHESPQIANSGSERTEIERAAGMMRVGIGDACGPDGGHQRRRPQGQTSRQRQRVDREEHQKCADILITHFKIERDFLHTRWRHQPEELQLRNPQRIENDADGAPGQRALRAHGDQIERNAEQRPCDIGQQQADRKPEEGRVLMLGGEIDQRVQDLKCKKQEASRDREQRSFPRLSDQRGVQRNRQMVAAMRIGLNCHRPQRRI